jgi:hypothetical protein
MNPDKVYPQMQQEDKVKKVAFQAIENVGENRVDIMLL